MHRPLPLCTLLILGAIAAPACDSAENDDDSGPQTCADLQTEESCHAARPDPNNYFATCAWVEWSRVQTDAATGMSQLIPAPPQCEYSDGSEVGCVGEFADLECAPSAEHRPLTKMVDGEVLVAFSDRICDRVLPPMEICTGDVDQLEPPACAMLCPPADEE